MIEDDKGILQMLPTVGFVVILLYAIMYIGTYMNGTIGSQLIDSFGTATERTAFENTSVNTLNNLSGDFDDNVDIVSVAAIITILTLPLMAVAAVRKIF